MHDAMTNRDVLIEQLRPELNLTGSPANPEEAFQNDTLRPILKFQNPIIVAHFRSYLHKFQPRFNAFNQDAQKQCIRQAVVKDVALKNDLITFVVGLFTVDEYQYYFAHRSGLKKRMVQMLISRLQSQVERLL